MKLIIGLGNPGTKYETTRHNVGFLAIDLYIAILGYKIEDMAWENKFNSLVLHSGHLDANSGHSDYRLVKPQTFMNNSGQAVREIVNFYKLSPADVLVIHDEVDLPFGAIRTTKSSSAAGHNGVQDIIDQLGTQDFARIRIGVESRASRNELPTDVFVLSPFTADELAVLEIEIFPKVAEQIRLFINS